MAATKANIGSNHTSSSGVGTPEAGVVVLAGRSTDDIKAASPINLLLDMGETG
jgi:hypothetical protein